MGKAARKQGRTTPIGYRTKVRQAQRRAINGPDRDFWLWFYRQQAGPVRIDQFGLVR